MVKHVLAAFVLAALCCSPVAAQSLSPEQKTAIGFKKAISKDPRAPGNEFYEETDGGGFNIHADTVWSAAVSSTPATCVSPDGVCQAYTLFNLVEDITVSGSKGWCAVSSGDCVTGARLRDWVPPKYGVSYTVKLYNQANEQVFTTDPITWYFDYEAGYLSIDCSGSCYSATDTATASTSFKVTGWRYVGDSVTDAIAAAGGTEVNNLSSIVTWANVPDVNITESSVTNHEAALSLTESQTSFGGSGNQMATSDGDGTLTWESGLTFDGTILDLVNADIVLGQTGSDSWIQFSGFSADDGQIRGWDENSIGFGHDGNPTFIVHKDGDATYAAGHLQVLDTASFADVTTFSSTVTIPTTSCDALNADGSGNVGCGAADLSVYLDNTDAQDLTLSVNTLAISGDPNTDVDLSGYLDGVDHTGSEYQLFTSNGSGGVDAEPDLTFTVGTYDLFEVGTVDGTGAIGINMTPGADGGLYFNRNGGTTDDPFLVWARDGIAGTQMRYVAQDGVCDLDNTLPCDVDGDCSVPGGTCDKTLASNRRLEIGTDESGGSGSVALTVYQGADPAGDYADTAVVARDCIGVGSTSRSSADGWLCGDATGLFIEYDGDNTKEAGEDYLSTTLDGLSDTDLGVESDGQLLIWENATSKWVNQTMDTDATIDETGTVSVNSTKCSADEYLDGAGTCVAIVSGAFTTETGYIYIRLDPDGGNVMLNWIELIGANGTDYKVNFDNVGVKYLPSGYDGVDYGLLYPATTSGCPSDCGEWGWLTGTGLGLPIDIDRGQTNKDSGFVYRTVGTQAVWKIDVGPGSYFVYLGAGDLGNNNQGPHDIDISEDNSTWVPIMTGRSTTVHGNSDQSPSSDTVMEDSTQSWTVDEFVGDVIYNTNDSYSWGTILSNTTTSITVDDMVGGTENDWDFGDNYQIVLRANIDFDLDECIARETAYGSPIFVDDNCDGVQDSGETAISTCVYNGPTAPTCDASNERCWWRDTDAGTDMWGNPTLPGTTYQCSYNTTETAWQWSIKYEPIVSEGGVSYETMFANQYWARRNFVGRGFYIWDQAEADAGCGITREGSTGDMLLSCVDTASGEKLRLGDDSGYVYVGTGNETTGNIGFYFDALGGNDGQFYWDVAAGLMRWTGDAVQSGSMTFDNDVTVGDGIGADDFAINFASLNGTASIGVDDDQDGLLLSNDVRVGDKTTPVGDGSVNIYSAAAGTSQIGLTVGAAGSETQQFAIQTSDAYSGTRLLDVQGDLTLTTSSGDVIVDDDLDVTGDIDVTGAVTGWTPALGTDTSGDYVSGATTGQGLAKTGTEGATLGLRADCSDDQVLKYTTIGSVWTCQNDDFVANTNAQTICNGTTTYLDGEGGCDDLSAVYEPAGITESDISDLSHTTDTTVAHGGSADELYTSDGAGGVVAETGLTFDGTTLSSPDVHVMPAGNVAEIRFVDGLGISNDSSIVSRIADGTFGFYTDATVLTAAPYVSIGETGIDALSTDTTGDVRVSAFSDSTGTQSIVLGNESLANTGVSLIRHVTSSSGLETYVTSGQSYATLDPSSIRARLDEAYQVYQVQVVIEDAGSDAADIEIGTTLGKCSTSTGNDCITDAQCPGAETCSGYTAGPQIFTQTTAPSSAVEGSLWIDTDGDGSTDCNGGECHFAVYNGTSWNYVNW